MSARLVVDNPVVMTWCFEGEANVYAEAVLECFRDGKAFGKGRAAFILDSSVTSVRCAGG